MNNDILNNPQKVMRQQLAASMKLSVYVQIQEQVWSTDVSKDVSFQKKFNGFYRVRRNITWQEQYYSLFEEAKKAPIPFEDVITYLYSMGKVEASFGSKMVATINPNMPIWDQYVMTNVGITVSNKGSRIQATVDAYDKLCDWYNHFLCTNNAKECLHLFDTLFPEYKSISDTKKIDFYLWTMR